MNGKMSFCIEIGLIKGHLGLLPIFVLPEKEDIKVPEAIQPLVCATFLCSLMILWRRSSVFD
jgi:hypothetical protein